MGSFFVTTPSYNQGAYLQENINSVNSSCCNAIHCVIDGLSSDETQNILNANDQKLSYWVSEPDSGQSEALNKGLLRREGDYISWLNSDDYYLPNALDTVHKIFLENPNVDIIHGGSILVDAKSRKFGYDFGQADGLPYRYYSGMCFPQPSSFIRRKTFELIGSVNKELHYAMDYELFLKLKLMGARFLKIKNLLSAYRHHDNSKTVCSPNQFAEEWCQIYCNFLHDEKSSSSAFELLKKLGLYKEQTDSYNRIRNLAPEEINLSLFYHLHYQAYFSYSAKKYCRAKDIAKTMLSLKPFTSLTIPLVKMAILAKYKLRLK